MILLVSPRDVDVGCVAVGRVGCEVLRRSVNSVTCARARVEERVPMRRVRGLEVEGSRSVDGEPEVDMRGWVVLVRGRSAIVVGEGRGEGIWVEVVAA